MSRHSEQREAQVLIQDRVVKINRCLNIICSGRVEAIPVVALGWKIVPAMKWDSIPVRCKGLELELKEEIFAMRLEEEIKLVCNRFSYKLEAKGRVTDHSQRTLDAGWHFRYELNDAGEIHSFENACNASAVATATSRRFPPFHMHVRERSDLGDSLHYPISEPIQPLNVVFDIIRLIKDEFVTNTR